jgi:hypothetical protein
MSSVTAILSLLHQPTGERNSAARIFRGEPVLAWTLRRLAQSKGITHCAILCWEDQLFAVQPIATVHKAFILSKAPRMANPMLDAITVACKWSDGWRGGLMGTCSFDRGFHAVWFNDICQKLQSDAVVLADPDAGLIDPILVDDVINHAQRNPAVEYCFSPAAPGLSAVLVRSKLLECFAAGGGYLGRMLNYFPDLPGRDPIARETCAPVPAPVARTTHRFTLDTQRQIHRIDQATVHLNGQLMQTEAEALVAAVANVDITDVLPRDITLEINTTRVASPLYWPGHYLSIHRPSLTLSQARGIFQQLASLDDIRLTLAGVGDPLLHPEVFDIIAAAHDAGIDSIHVETDLLELDAEKIKKLAESHVEVLTVHLPAATAATYQKIMGTDGLAAVVANIRQLLALRQSLSRGTPLLVPTFTKCKDNLHEMEAWYDQWLRAVGSAVITGPTDYAGQIPDVAVADMTPPRRRPCARLASRLSILCTGQVVSCEQDFLVRQPIGDLDRHTLREIWQSQLSDLRCAHASGQWDLYPVCQSCREWHRP